MGRSRLRAAGTLPVVACLLWFPLSARPQDSRPPILALVNGEPITQERLDEEIRPQLAQLEEQARRLRETMLLRLIDHLLVEQAARKENLSAEEFLARRLETAAVSKEEVEAAWSRSRERFPGTLAAEAKYRIRRSLEDQRRAEALRRLLDDLRRQSTIVNYLNRQAAAELAAAPGPSLGAAGAPVEVVEFADFECPFCRKAQAVLGRALARWEGRLRLVFRHFPLAQHPHAFAAAVAAVCAGQQGRFWEYRRALFEHAGPLNEPALVSLAEAQGLDAGEFDKCRKDPAAAERVRRDIELGRKAGVSGTPAFFVNGRWVADFTQLEAAIEEALRHAQANR